MLVRYKSWSEPLRCRFSSWLLMHKPDIRSPRHEDHDSQFPGKHLQHECITVDVLRRASISSGLSRCLRLGIIDCLSEQNGPLVLWLSRLFYGDLESGRAGGAMIQYRAGISPKSWKSFYMDDTIRYSLLKTNVALTHRS